MQNVCWFVFGVWESGFNWPHLGGYVRAFLKKVSKRRSVRVCSEKVYGVFTFGLHFSGTIVCIAVCIKVYS